MLCALHFCSPIHCLHDYSLCILPPPYFYDERVILLSLLSMIKGSFFQRSCVCPLPLSKSIYNTQHYGKDSNCYAYVCSTPFIEILDRFFIKRFVKHLIRKTKFCICSLPLNNTKHCYMYIIKDSTCYTYISWAFYSEILDPLFITHFVQHFIRKTNICVCSLPRTSLKHTTLQYQGSASYAYVCSTCFIEILDSYLLHIS